MSSDLVEFLAMQKIYNRYPVKDWDMYKQKLHAQVTGTLPETPSRFLPKKKKKKKKQKQKKLTKESLLARVSARKLEQDRKESEFDWEGMKQKRKVPTRFDIRTTEAGSYEVYHAGNMRKVWVGPRGGMYFKTRGRKQYIN